jgi:transposase
MMGIKARIFQPIVHVSLEDLVPADHFYRHVERTLDLSFVRDLVRDRYSAFGRPSIDPVVFFKLQVVMFFEGIRSERQLEYVGSDRLSVRWYLGYDLNEPLPDHSSMTRIRDRYGVQIFRRFFETIAERCQEAGLIWGKEVYADATLVEANADRDNMLPRFAVEAHLHHLFGAGYQPPKSEASVAQDAGTDTVTASSRIAASSPTDVLEFATDLSPEQLDEVAAHNQEHLDWYERNGEPDRSIKRGGYQRTSDLWVSLSDPDAVLMRQHNHGVHLRYRTHYLVDGGKARIILGVLVTAADVMENMPFLDMLWRACFRSQIWPRSATGDTTYGTVEIIRALEDAGIRAYMPLTDWDKRTSFFGRDEFRYDAEADQYICPNGAILAWERHDYVNQTHHYRADAATCSTCPLKPKCTTSEEGRSLRRSFFQEYLDRVAAYHQTAAYKKAYQKRKVWVEPLFGEGQQWHGLRRFRLRGLRKVNCEGVMTATGQNLKRLLSWRGWGRRHFPGAAHGVVLPRNDHALFA